MTELSSVVRASSRASTGWGIATVSFGVLAVVAPGITGLTVNTVLAVLMFAAGITITAYIFSAGSFGRGLLQFLFGGLTALAGVAMLLFPLASIATLTIMLAAYLVADGILGITAALQSRPHGWGWLVFSGICSIVLGAFLYIEWPVSGQYAIGVLIGVRLMIAGWSIIMLGAAGELASDRIDALKRDIAHSG